MRRADLSLLPLNLPLILLPSPFANTQLNAHLLPPLTFTHTPHQSAPIRGSPPIATRHIQHPTSGREHMLITFWVHGRGIGEEESLGWMRSGYRTVIEWGREAGEWIGVVAPVPVAEPVKPVEVVQTGSGFLGGLLGGLGLRGAQPRRETKGLPPPGTYKVGEVHGDYVKVSTSYHDLSNGSRSDIVECIWAIPVTIACH